MLQLASDSCTGLWLWRYSWKHVTRVYYNGLCCGIHTHKSYDVSWWWQVNGWLLRCSISAPDRQTSLWMRSLRCQQWACWHLVFSGLPWVCIYLHKENVIQMRTGWFRRIWCFCMTNQSSSTSFMQIGSPHVKKFGSWKGQKEIHIMFWDLPWFHTSTWDSFVPGPCFQYKKHIHQLWLKFHAHHLRTALNLRK